MMSGDTNTHVLEEMIEPLNHYFHVPVAARMIPPLLATPVTPNQVTYFSVVVGIGSAYAFSLGTLFGMVLAGLLLEFSLILDCVDGQLARAKQMSTEWGRILDGLGGYVSNLAVVVGIGLGYPETRTGLIVLTVVTIFRAIAYDFFKQFATARYQEGIDWLAREIHTNNVKIESGGALIWKVYGAYLKVQGSLFGGSGDPPQIPPNLTEEQRRRFYENNRGLFRLWRWNGPDLVFFLLAVTAILGKVDAFIWPLAILVVLQFISIMILHQIRFVDETVS